MAFTFGICGPLALSPRDAVVIDSCYNGGFMFGRLVSALIAAFVTPRNMILMSLVLCIGAAVFLCFQGGSSAISLYVGTAVLGFFVSWQFGSCFSWVAKKKNITGRLSSIFFIGCGFGSLVTPPLSGFFFTRYVIFHFNSPITLLYSVLDPCPSSTWPLGSASSSRFSSSPSGAWQGFLPTRLHTIFNRSTDYYLIYFIIFKFWYLLLLVIPVK